MATATIPQPRPGVLDVEPYRGGEAGAPGFAKPIRLASNDPNAPLTWLAGVFYSRARQEAIRSTYAVSAPEDIGIYSDDYSIDANRAVFGELALKLTPRWRVSLGARLGRTVSDSTRHAACAPRAPCRTRRPFCTRPGTRAIR